MQINPLVYRGYDIRGVAGEDFTPEKVEALGRGFGTMLRKRKIRQMVLGYDARLTGPEYSEAFAKGVISTGVDVIDIGMVMIQTIYFAQYYFQVNGAVMITASHNPASDNGFKMGMRFSQTIVEEIQELKDIVASDAYWDKDDLVGTIRKDDVNEAYYQDIIKRSNITKKFKVVVDTGHGVAGKFIPELLEKVGCEVVGQMLEPDGSFPAGTPDPTDNEMIKRVQERVKKENADLGFAFDGDGDRIGIVDDQGEVIWNDELLAIFAREILTRFPGAKIIYNTLCSQAVKKVIEQYKGEPIMWRVGHSYLKEKLVAEKAFFAGELSGHMFFADNFYGHDDGSFVACRLLDFLSEVDKPLSEVRKEMPQYISSPQIKIGCDDKKKIEVIKRLAQEFRDDFKGAEITDDTVIPGDDGVRADFDDGMIVLRYSQNGPYVTFKFEASNEDVYEERRLYLKEKLQAVEELEWESNHSTNADFILK
ncbi:MAG: phosphomannomutase/phosphoglucomutase [Patescibacteria group bacterium]